MANLTAYKTQMFSHLLRASQALNIPTDAIAAQWYNESGGGTSDMARHYNNHAGIKYSSNSRVARRRSDSDFAAYGSLYDFTTDYIRVMSLDYYDDVRRAGASGDVAGTVQAIGASPYDAGHYNDGSGAGSKLLKLLGLNGGGLTEAEKTEIARKASLGLALTNPSAAATSYYEEITGKKYPAVCPTCHRPL